MQDARSIWRLVVDSGQLDANSLYCYLLWCRDFSETSLVACLDSRVVAFVTAYRPPGRPQTLFVWQIGVSPEVRRQGVAGRLLRALIAHPNCRDIRFVEATVTPSNAASRRLFKAFAEHMQAPCEIGVGFESALFGNGDGQQHEEEQLFRIGPLNPSNSTTTQ